MELPSKFKEIFQGYSLNKKAGPARQRKMQNLSTASQVGIVFYLDSEAMYHIVHGFTRSLQKKGKEVKAIAYVPDKLATVSILPVLSFDFIYKKELNWYDKPGGERVEDFIERPFDLLIDLSHEKAFPLQYIIQRSVARCKIGRNTPENQAIFDLMITSDENQDVRDYIENIVHYLTLIETR